MTTGVSTGGAARRLSSAARREEIVVAAREVFCAKGFAGGRMRAIAERAGVTEPLLYRHFSSREELYRLAVEDHLATLLDDAVARADRLAADPDLEGPELVRALVRVHLEVMAEIAPVASVALYEEPVRGRRLYQAVVRPRLRDAAASLHRAATGRDLPAGRENLVAVSLLGVPFGVALDSMMRGEAVDVDDMTDRISLLFQRRP
jgi:AcrR family transcriptional regulator